MTQNELANATCKFCYEDVVGDGIKRIWHIWKYHRDKFIETFEEGYNDEPQIMKLIYPKQEQYEQLIAACKEIDKQEESMK